MMLRLILVILAVWVASSVPHPHKAEIPGSESYDSSGLLNEAANLLHEHHVHNLGHGHEGHTHKDAVYKKIENLAPQHSNNKRPSTSSAQMDTSVHTTLDSKLYYSDHYDEGGQYKFAYCDLKPSSDLPDSKVQGRIDISNKLSGIDKAVYFDINVSGTDVKKDGRHYSLQVNERAMSGQNCNETGTLFTEPRRTGMLVGFFTVSENGEPYRSLSPSLDIPFEKAVGKAIVLYSMIINDRSEGEIIRAIGCCNIVQTSE